MIFQHTEQLTRHYCLSVCLYICLSAPQRSPIIHIYYIIQLWVSFQSHPLHGKTNAVECKYTQCLWPPVFFNIQIGPSRLYSNVFFSTFQKKTKFLCRTQILITWQNIFQEIVKGESKIHFAPNVESEAYFSYCPAWLAI